MKLHIAPGIRATRMLWLLFKYWPRSLVWNLAEKHGFGWFVVREKHCSDWNWLNLQRRTSRLVRWNQTSEQDQCCKGIYYHGSVPPRAIALIYRNGFRLCEKIMNAKTNQNMHRTKIQSSCRRSTWRAPSVPLRNLLKGQWTLLSMIHSLQEPERNISKSLTCKHKHLAQWNWPWSNLLCGFPNRHLIF